MQSGQTFTCHCPLHKYSFLVHLLFPAAGRCSGTLYSSLQRRLRLFAKSAYFHSHKAVKAGSSLVGLEPGGGALKSAPAFPAALSWAAFRGLFPKPGARAPRAVRCRSLIGYSERSAELFMSALAEREAGPRSGLVCMRGHAHTCGLHSSAPPTGQSLPRPRPATPRPEVPAERGRRAAEGERLRSGARPGLPGPSPRR